MERPIKRRREDIAALTVGIHEFPDCVYLRLTDSHMVWTKKEWHLLRACDTATLVYFCRSLRDVIQRQPRTFNLAIFHFLKSILTPRFLTWRNQLFGRVPDALVGIAYFFRKLQLQIQHVNYLPAFYDPPLIDTRQRIHSLSHTPPL